MPLIQIRITPPELAAPIIEAMADVLARRHHWKISRKVFLIRWHQLRRRLAATIEYQTFRELVIARDEARCQDCGRNSLTVHHKRPVSRAPRLALSPDNGQVVCTECHKLKHRHMRAA